MQRSVRTMWLAAVAATAIFVTSLVLVGSAPGHAGFVSAKITPTKGNVDTRNKSDYRRDVNKLRLRVDRRFGRDRGGLDILRFGIGPEHKRRPASTTDVKSYEAVLARMLNPPPVRAVYTPSPSVPQNASTSAQAPPSAPTGGGGGPEQFVSCESGGSWTAVNGSTGAYGRYQIMPMHYAPGGLCAGMGRDPASQTRCANVIYQTQGSGAWAQCGG